MTPWPGSLWLQPRHGHCRALSGPKRFRGGEDSKQCDARKCRPNRVPRGRSGRTRTPSPTLSSSTDVAKPSAELLAGRLAHRFSCFAWNCSFKWRCCEFRDYTQAGRKGTRVWWKFRMLWRGTEMRQSNKLRC
jgi:hypothetical protein